MVIPTTFKETFWLPAHAFRPAQSPYPNPAPNTDIWLPTSGNAFSAVYFATGIVSSATSKFILGNNLTSGGQINCWFSWLSDNADVVNNVNFRYGHQITADGANVDVAVVTTQAFSVPNSGQYFINIEAISFAIGGTLGNNRFVTVLAQRNVDAFPGGAWMLGVKYLIESDLS
jgi:hypothetical protein